MHRSKARSRTKRPRSHCRFNGGFPGANSLLRELLTGSSTNSFRCRSTFGKECNLQITDKTCGFEVLFELDAGALDELAAKAATRGRFHWRTAGFAPGDVQARRVVSPVDAPGE